MATRVKRPVRNRRNLSDDSEAPASQRKTPARERVTRVAFGGNQLKLEVINQDPDYWYYWQKDQGDNLQRMVDAGYEFVTREIAGRYAPEALTNTDLMGGNQSITDLVEVFGGTNAHGDEVNLVLMRQPNEFHLEDMAAREQKNLRVDEAIYRGEFTDDPGDGSQETRYGNIDVTVKHEE